MMPDPSILGKISPRTSVLVWASDRELSPELSDFQTVDYLLDGLVRKHLAEQTELTQVSFVHTLFGKNFWVAFLNTGSVNAEKFTQNLLALVPTTEREHLIILGSQLLLADLERNLDKAFGFVEKI
ncbi:MAG: hypothetical protein ACLGG7_10130 [Bacteriovoracia bacterium]